MMSYEADLACNEARRNSFKRNKERRKFDVQNSTDSKAVIENEFSSFSPASPEEDLWERSQMLRQEQEENRRTRWICKPSCIPISIILILIVLVVLLPLLDHSADKLLSGRNKSHLRKNSCKDDCQISLVESIPEGLIYPANSVKFPSTYETWMQLIETANHSIDIASFYWTLRKDEIYEHPSSQQGEDVFQALKQAGIERKIHIRIAQNAPDKKSGPNTDTETLLTQNAAEVRSINFTKLFDGGVLHTKLWIIDKRHIYVGSANMDWRSLTQVKEMGLVAYNCSCLADDVSKIFEVYWLVGERNSVLPPVWPAALATNFNMNTSMNTIFNNISYTSYISSSPPPMSTIGRTNDIDSILNVISKAEVFIYIAVMDYYPLTLYTPVQKFWPIIDNALRRAAIEKNVKIRLLISWWTHSRSSADYFLRSLADLSGIQYKNRTIEIQVKRFVVPTSPDQAKIPFARVNHNKYMVTDNTAYIGTSNWSGDYFINTAGVGFVIQESSENDNNNNTAVPDIHDKESFRKQLQNVFERDWDSIYAKSLIR